MIYRDGRISELDSDGIRKNDDVKSLTPLPWLLKKQTDVKGEDIFIIYLCYGYVTTQLTVTDFALITSSLFYWTQTSKPLLSVS